MEKIANHGLKIDLHIHSAKSSKKDGKKVKNNTVSNIPVLIQKLNEQGVNICSITDHDTFSYAMYKALKQAEVNDNSIQKVLPGVEFTVCFLTEGRESMVHVVAIFSDEEEDKVQRIEGIIEENPPSYNQAYKEEDFLALLRQIDINTILIAHQKNTLSSAKTKKNDANTVGETKFLEFVYTDYFEALEFKNRRNEVINKNYLIENQLEGRVRFVTGTDCHDWSVYPAETPQDTITDFPYTYAKCLPTFKGLVMAITDHNRLKSVDSFFTATQYTLSSIKFTHDNVDVEIPLSKGINVIIGDNSVGKSLLLHALTGYTKPTKLLPGAVKTGYKKYLEQLHIGVAPQISEDHIFSFDMQGEIRQKFDENQLNATEFLGPYFPQPVDNSPYKALLENEVVRLITYLRKKFDIDLKRKKLSTFNVVIGEENADSLTFLNNIGYAKPKSDKYSNISPRIESILTQLSALSGMNLEQEDIDSIQQFSKVLDRIKNKYDNKVKQIEAESCRMEKVSVVIKKSSSKHNRGVTDNQKKLSAFNDNTSELKSQVLDLIRESRTLRNYSPDIPKTQIHVNSNSVYEYEFISKLKIDQIDTEYFLSLISRTLKNGKSIAWDTITEEELKGMLLRYDDSSVLQFFQDALIALIDEDLKPKNSIINQGKDKYEELSAGFNSKIYFDLLSYETQRDGVYIIDQPEDNVSQKSIREYLLDRFKTMGENRQVIMVTHNPQFIVNLDVDNLIFLSKKDGTLEVHSGALEYTCPQYNVLEIVAQNIDGGLESIKKRWKRYEKTIEI